MRLKRKQTCTLFSVQIGYQHLWVWDIMAALCIVLVNDSSSMLHHYMYVYKKFCYRRRTARRAVSWNLANSCTTVGTSCSTNPQQIEVIITELEHYGRRTCNKLRWPLIVSSVSLTVDEFCWQLTRSTCYGTILKVRSLGQNSTGKYPYFWR